ncbi:MAG TPA: hypothetical protein GX707_17450 [Epulopiscium sp.]|nr:hypothetical protein [Candidatus Epulonipiscium sp.]
MSVAKLNILKETFGQEFNINRFKQFTREFFNEPEMLPETKRTGIWKEYQEHINSYYTVAKYADAEANNLIVVAVELKRNTSIDRARSMQRNFISKILDENNLEAAIVAFYTEDEPSWRLSFVRLDYTFTDKGLELELTPARRYSYLIGENEPNHTAQSQLLNIFADDKHNPTLNKIEEAFSVESVTIDFFNQYKEKYLELKEYLEQDNSFVEEAHNLGFEVNKFAEQFSKKLMGQLAFLYFIQKKGWLGVKIVPKTITKQELSNIYNLVDETKKKVLQKVYQEDKKGIYTLNIDLISSRDFTEHEAEILSAIFLNNEKFDEPWGKGYRQFIRDVLWKHCVIHKKNFFDDYLEPFFYQALNKERKHHYFKLFNCKIPFLNGGLFEPLEGYNWKDIKLEIPNKLFSNKEEKGRLADGILDIFDRFNFTMNEAEPLDKEVAVDPEMLGKIFENLLDVKDRKSKGAFYTPREIVHYMCQESLINYIVNEINVPYEDVKEFILYGEIIRDADGRTGVGYGKALTIKQSIYDNIVEIDEALKNVRVADPAVGSGAFPLGMLNEIVRARYNITEYIIRKDKEGAFDRRFGEDFIRRWRSPYKMKWDTIKNSIFAVDIEASAVDITKLRLWLSVVVDQEIDEENPEPHPLPNLDMNIHVGNSLIDEYEGIKLFDKSILLKDKDNKNKKSGRVVEQLRLLFDSDEILEEMFDKQSQYFDETNEVNKKALKDRIDILRNELIIYKLRESGQSEALQKYNSSKDNKSMPYFIWELEFAKVFKEKGGFDIVMGNPPYIKVQNLDSQIVSYFKEKFEAAKGKFDIYVVFIEKSFDLINEKGMVSFIHPHRFLKAEYGKGIRKYLKENVALKKFINFGVAQVFDTATTYTGIFFYSNYNKHIEYAESSNLDLYNIEFKRKKYRLLKDRWEFNHTEFEILDKIYGQEKSVKDIFKGIYQGLITVGDDIFILKGDISEEGVFKGFSKELDEYVTIEGELMKPLLKGEHIRRYGVPSSDIYAFYPHYIDAKSKTKPFEEENFRRDYPLGYKYILNFKEYLVEKKVKYKTNPKYWYSLHRARDMDIFDNVKIITPQLQNYPNFTLDNNSNYPDAGGYSLVLNESYYGDYKYYLGILNSKLMWYFIKNTSTPFNSGYYYFKTKYLEPFGIPESADLATKNKIINLVDRIMKQDDPNLKLLEMELDKAVYKLYDLNNDEINHLEKEY